MYFTSCNTKEELKKEFKRLSRLLHPDFNNGKDEDFKKMLNQYQDKLNEGFEKTNNNSNFDFNNMADDFKKAFMTVSILEEIEAEIIGSWIWISGNTIKVKDILKNSGFKWASKKKMWYFGTPSKSRGKKTIDDIRKTYGSEKIKTRKGLKIA